MKRRSRAAVSGGVLLRETCRWIRRLANRLERLRRPAFDQFQRLQQTAEYKLAVQLSDEGREDEGNVLPAYAMVATFDNLLRDLDEMCDCLRESARVNGPRRKRVRRE